MKKLFVFAYALLLGSGVASSQEAFKHLSVGLEAATTGAGLELALPVVSDHLVFAAGYNFGNIALNTLSNTTLNLAELSNNVNKYINDANDYLSEIPGESARLTPIPASTNISGSGAIRLGTFKAILEYYPAKASNFHINAGVYIGNADIFSADARCSELWDIYNSDYSKSEKLAATYPEFKKALGKIPELKASINGRTFQIKEPGNINLGLQVSKVRPYLGLGFGRSIPDTHFGFQFDLGVIYTGKWTITSTNEVSGTSEVIIKNDDLQRIMELVDKICIYPQLSFRLIYRIF